MILLVDVGGVAARFAPIVGLVLQRLEHRLDAAWLVEAWSTAFVPDQRCSNC